MKQAIQKKSTKWQRTYLKKNPWVRNHQFSKLRARRKGWEHTQTIADFKFLWLRDNADKMKCPSIDRIDPTKGYIDGNCRFIEDSENTSIGNKGRKTWNTGKVGVKTNDKGGTPWNKGRKQNGKGN